MRATLVRTRVALINQVKGTLRSQGVRLSSTTTSNFVAKWGEGKIPRSMRTLLEPLVGAIGELTDRIEAVQKELVTLSHSDELLERLQEVPGVGPLVSVSFLAWVDRVDRFSKSRDVGACLGLRPIVRASGGSLRSSHISREGDKEMRWLLVQAAHAALATHRDSALKRWGERLAKSGRQEKGHRGCGAQTRCPAASAVGDGRELPALPGGGVDRQSKLQQRGSKTRENCWR
ncbi:MAG: transposase [Nocardioides sp.]